MNSNADHRIHFDFPRFEFQHTFGFSVAGLPAVMDSGRSKVDVSRVVFAIETWRIELDDVHGRSTTIARELFDHWCIALVLGQPLHKLSNNVAQLMNLLLTRDVTSTTLAD
jgi:hypothetical protein